MRTPITNPIADTSQRRRTSDDLISQGPGGGTVDEREPIGVPADFTTPGFANQVEINAPIVRIPPQYFDGDEWMPARWNAGEVADLQRALDAAGVIRRGTSYRVGVYDDATRSAYTRLLGFANGSGLTWTQALRRWSEGSQEEEAGPGGGSLAPRIISLSNPDDLRAVFKESSRKLLGAGRVDDAALDRLVSAYQAEERRYQTQRSSLSDTTVIEPPSLETFADEELHKLNPVAYDANKVLKGVRIVAKMLEDPNYSPSEAA